MDVLREALPQLRHQQPEQAPRQRGHHWPRRPRQNHTDSRHHQGALGPAAQRWGGLFWQLLSPNAGVLRAGAAGNRVAQCGRGGAAQRGDWLRTYADGGITPHVPCTQVLSETQGVTAVPFDQIDKVQAGSSAVAAGSSSGGGGWCMQRARKRARAAGAVISPAERATSACLLGCMRM